MRVNSEKGSTIKEESLKVTGYLVDVRGAHLRPS